MVEMPFFLIIIIIAPSVRYELMEYDAVLQIAFLLMYKHVCRLEKLNFYITIE